MVPGPRLARLALKFPLKGLFLGRPVVRDGQTLDRTVQWLLALERRTNAPAMSDETVKQARGNARRTYVLLAPTDPSVTTHDDTLRVVRSASGAVPESANHTDPIPIRRYRPRGLGERDLPTLLYLHGGGWVVGNLDTHDGVCRALATQANCQVIAVHYRRAPEHRYPAAADDAFAALQALLADPTAHGVDPARIAVGGDSAGGNLTAVVSLRARDAGLRAPCLQLMIYPATDHTREAASFDLFAEGFLLTRDDIRWFRSHYLPDVAQRAERDASPLLADDLSGLAPAYVATAGYDPLRDEGRAYAARLAEAGVPTQEHCFPDLVHGYLNLAGAIPAARAALDHAAAALRAGLGCLQPS